MPARVDRIENARTFVAILLVALTVLGLAAIYTKAQNRSALWSIAADPIKDELWLKRDRSVLPREMPQRWSPFHWARNASHVAAHADELSASERQGLADTLLEMLEAHSEERDGVRFTVYRFDHRVMRHTVTSPWYSALGNLCSHRADALG